jgi:serine O-acetyltransferase
MDRAPRLWTGEVASGRSAAIDLYWHRLRSEAEAAMAREPALTSLLVSTILEQPDLASALAYRLGQRLAGDELSAEMIARTVLKVIDAEPTILAAAHADLKAVVERDPASARLIEPFLFFKGFSAIETHRVAHHLWLAGRRDMALVLQSRSSSVFQTDIHPGATIGQGIFIDHATGVVIGETAEIDDEVSILQDVTLGGTGTHTGKRHPTIRTGVMIGAGAQIFGPVEIGAYSKIAAGSLVTTAVPAHSTAVGTPARIVLGDAPANPARNMDQMLTERDYSAFTWVI